jgi:hypothetical protein
MTRPRRPLSVTLLALGVLSLTTLNAARLYTALAAWPWLAQYAPIPGPLYLALTGLAWTLAGLALYLGLWLGWERGRQAAFLLSLVYAAYYWLDRLLLQTDPARPNWLFAVLFTVLGLAYTYLALHRPKARRYFRPERT